MARRKLKPRSRESSTGSKDSDTDVLVNKTTRMSTVLKEIKYLKKSVKKLLIPRNAFVRLVVDIVRDIFPNTSVQGIKSSALDALQEATEAYMVQFFEDCFLLTLHVKRTTLQIQDMYLIRRFRGRGDVINK